MASAPIDDVAHLATIATLCTLDTTLQPVAGTGQLELSTRGDLWVPAPRQPLLRNARRRQFLTTAVHTGSPDEHVPGD
jgi:hypothetical protein